VDGRESERQAGTESEHCGPWVWSMDFVLGWVITPV
jgi:hypothetical protein